jgi:hypothetical protein
MLGYITPVTCALEVSDQNDSLKQNVVLNVEKIHCPVLHVILEKGCRNMISELCHSFCLCTNFLCSLFFILFL